MSVWGYLHDKDGSINQETKDYISTMTPIKMLMHTIGEHGTDKGWFYLAGPKKTPVMIMTPWAQMPEIFDQKYPGHNEQNWWDFFFPGMVESWNKWTSNPDFIAEKPDNHLTLTPLYEDAGGTGLMITFFAPLWNKERTENFGAAAVDYNINNILNIVKNEKIGETGFTFLIQTNGNVLGLADESFEKLELPHRTVAGDGVEISSFDLENSRIEELSSIAKQFNEEDEFTVYSFSDNNGNNYLISFERFQENNLWNGNNAIIRDSLYIAAIVPKEEVFKARDRIYLEIKTLSHHALLFFIISTVIFAFISAFFSGWYAYKNTNQIRKMTDGLSNIGKKNYDVSIDIISKDDLGYLARTFNHMIGEVRKSYAKLELYAHDLEDKVKERTEHLEEANQKLQELSQIDGLTKVHNRRYFDERLEEVWREYSRLNHPVSIILIDIDYFKQFNDNYGHQAGDLCLCSVASALKKQINRSSDVLARYGGEEFVAIVCVDIDNAYLLAEKMRIAVQELSIKHESSKTKTVSISLGVASAIPAQNVAKGQLIKNADIALYESKEKGRNMVSIREITKRA
jgi:sigma-B regulation protein RsbU (phosphoserine phosphatase)